MNVTNVTNMRDRAMDLRWRRVAALLAIPLFAFYFGGVVGGSILQGMALPSAQMGWGQQIGGIVAVAIAIATLRGRRALLALFIPERPWLMRSIVVGLSVTAAGWLAGDLIGDPVERHGLEYFAYQATMPGLSEELGFRGLVLGVLVAALAGRSRSAFNVLAILITAAVPFAALHILDRSGVALVVLSCFTLYAGVAFGWLRLTTGSLLTAILAHNLANVASGLLDNLLLWR